MKIFAKLLVASVLALTLLPFAANTEENDAPSQPHSEKTREERRAEWESLSEEEKQAKREEMRAKREQRRAEWEALTPEERAARRAEMREKWEAMTPEQREAIKKRRKERGRRAHRLEHHGDQKDQSE